MACNGCVDVCPENLIRLVGLSKLIEDEEWMDKAVEEFGDIRQLPPEELDQLGAVMMKDETTCIRCAMCASRCPTHAIPMKQFDFYRECVTRADAQSQGGLRMTPCCEFSLRLRARPGEQPALPADVRAHRAVL